MKQIDYSRISTEDLRAITEIVKICATYFDYDRIGLVLDLTVCHIYACPLQLQAMVDTPNIAQVLHDIHGISRHLNRDTFQLDNHFRPRFAL